MKKNIILGALAAGAMAMTFGACGSGNTEAQGADTLLNKESLDSMAVYYGQLMGGYFNNSIADTKRLDSIDVDKQEFLKGLQLVLSHDCSEDMAAGIGAGLQIKANLDQFKAQGMALDRRKVLEMIRTEVLADSVGQDKAEAYKRSFDKYMEQVNKRLQMIDEKRMMESPQGVANNNAGKAAVAKAKAANEGAVEGTDGMLSIVETVGDLNIIENEPIVANFVISHVDGKEITRVAASPVMLSGQPEGVRQAIKTIGYGGKGRFFIPPTQFMGVMGVPEMGVGPMEWVVVDIEVIGKGMAGGMPVDAVPGQSVPVRL